MLCFVPGIFPLSFSLLAALKIRYYSYNFIDEEGESWWESKCVEEPGFKPSLTHAEACTLSTLFYKFTVHKSQAVNFAILRPMWLLSLGVKEQSNMAAKYINFE